MQKLIIKNTLTLNSKDKSTKVPAYLKIVDKYSVDFTFCRFGAQSNGVPSLVSGSQQLTIETSVSLELLYLNQQVNIGQQDLICL